MLKGPAVGFADRCPLHLVPKNRIGAFGVKYPVGGSIEVHFWRMEAASGTLTYRTMVASEAHLPECGVGNRRRPLLGVRPNIDVFPDSDGTVTPDGEHGMSVAPSPAVLPPHYRPMFHGGTSILPCWALDLSVLAPTLNHVSTSPTHGVISNVEAMLLDDLQAALCATAPQWDPIARKETA